MRDVNLFNNFSHHEATGVGINPGFDAAGVPVHGDLIDTTNFRDAPILGAGVVPVVNAGLGQPLRLEDNVVNNSGCLYDAPTTSHADRPDPVFIASVGVPEGTNHNARIISNMVQIKIVNIQPASASAGVRKPACCGKRRIV